MGLIKVAFDTAKGVVRDTLRDQAEIVLRCDDMGNHVLIERKTSNNGIIRDGSCIIVNPGQMAVIIDNGKVLDASAEPGSYEFRSDASPTFFQGNFKGMFKEMWTRFVFGGATFQDQAVYFINVKEIMNNGFGTPTPVMYRDWEHCMADARRPGHYVPIRVGIRCAGNYTFQIENPALFLKTVGGTTKIYQKDLLVEQMRIEIISVFQSVLNSLCNEENKVYPMDLPSKGLFIKELMDIQTFDKSIRERGIKINSFNVISVNLDDESKRKIDDFERTGDFASQQANLINAVNAAASNDSGAGMGFMNLNMMNNAVGGMFQGAMPGPSIVQNGQTSFQNSAQNTNQTSETVCSNCKSVVTGKFCSNCGTPVPIAREQFCSNCGTKVNGNFCSNCGTKMG